MSAKIFCFQDLSYMSAAKPPAPPPLGDKIVWPPAMAEQHWTAQRHTALVLFFLMGGDTLRPPRNHQHWELLREGMSSPFWKRSVHHATALTTLYSMYHSYSYCKWFLDGVLDTLNLMIYTKVQFHYIILKHTQLFQTWVHAINVQFVFELYLDAYNLQDTRRCTALVPTLISTVHGIY